jgi:DNA-binding GntR family transcriptional regulator
MVSAKKKVRKTKVSSPDVVFRRIVEGLDEGRYVPRQRLVEADLAQEFNVGRGTIREALRRLEAEGIVSLHPHRGARITWLTRSDVIDVYAMVEVLTGLAARLSAERIHLGGNRKIFSESLQELLRFKDQDNFLKSTQARNSFYNSFYKSVLQICGNRQLIRMLPSILVHLTRVQIRKYEYERASEYIRFAEYQKIGAAILAGDAAGAERETRRHQRKNAAWVARLPDDAFAPEDGSY